MDGSALLMAIHEAEALHTVGAAHDHLVCGYCLPEPDDGPATLADLARYVLRRALRLRHP